MSQKYRDQDVATDSVMSALAEHFEVEGWRCAPNNFGPIAIFTACYECYHDPISCDYTRERIKNEVKAYTKDGTIPYYALRVHELYCR